MVIYKLVRDGVPQAILRSGELPMTRTATDNEIEGLLKAKLVEEVQEFLANPILDELADIVEVVLAIASELRYTHGELEELRRAKRIKYGAFSQRIIWLGNSELKPQ
jgi:predicted house-cleaning noncanonical NTP pyrophosphatase (MazG superfamily)